MAVGEPRDPANPEERTTRQRRFRRYLTDLPITVSLPDGDLEGYCNQIAEGGLGAFLPEEVRVGSVVVLHFAVPSPPTELHVQAVVRYQIGFQHGLEFVSLDEGERLAIRQFCRELPSVSSV
jgi:PilZ domain